MRLLDEWTDHFYYTNEVAYTPGGPFTQDEVNRLRALKAQDGVRDVRQVGAYQDGLIALDLRGDGRGLLLAGTAQQAIAIGERQNQNLATILAANAPRPFGDISSREASAWAIGILKPASQDAAAATATAVTASPPSGGPATPTGGNGGAALAVGIIAALALRRR